MQLAIILQRAFLGIFLLSAPVLRAAVDSPTTQVRLNVEKFELKNGLTVLLHQDRTVPLIAYHTWYRVGSRNESPGVTGAAHMLEHMMFKGAKKYSGKDFDRILNENGIVNNAFTSWDYTGFYEKLPSSKLELIMDMEVDRMRDLILKPEDLKSELQVVGEERRWRVDNSPPSLLREAVLGELYSVHPYRWPVIGYMADIQAYTVEKLKHFYDTYYVPNNAVLVIAGDFDIPSTKALVEKYYGTLKPNSLPKTEFPKELPFKKIKSSVIDSEVQSSSIMLTYPGIETGHEDSFALDLLASILGSGASSRLYKKLIYQDQIAMSASAYNMTLTNPGFFTISASLKPGQKVDPVRKVFAEEIEKLRTTLVSTEELQKAKNLVMKDFVDGLTTIDGKAQALAVNEIVYGSYLKLYSDLERYSKVKVEDIQRVAKRYINPQQYVLGILNPKQGKKQ